MPQLRGPLKKSYLRALGANSNRRAERLKQSISPWAGHHAYRVGLVSSSGRVDHAAHTGVRRVDRADRNSQFEPRAVAHGRLGHRASGRDRVGIAALRLVGGERDVVDIYGRLEPAKL